MASILPVTALNVKAEAVAIPRVIKISWTLPPDPNFREIVVHRRTDNFQNDPTNPFGVEIYRGTDTVIYDYHLFEPATTNLLTIPDIYDIIKTNPEEARNFLQGGVLYYYTVFAVDKDGNYHANNATKVAEKPIKEFFMGEKLYHLLPEIYIANDKFQELKKFFEILGYVFDYMYSQIQMTTDLINIDYCRPKELEYIADFLGWDLDKTLDISTQRASLKAAYMFYRYAGTKQGLDLLVKYASGFPKSSGILEGFSFDHYTLDFGVSPEAPIRYLDHITPDFDNMDFNLIGTADDPLHYTPDFSFNSKMATDKFFVYVRPTIPLTQEQKILIEQRVRKLVDQFKPIGTEYEFEIYDV